MINRDEITIIRHTFSDSVGKLIKNRGYKCIQLFYGQNNKYLRRLRMAWQKFNLPFISIWYNKEALKSTGKIMLFDSICTPQYLKWLRKHNPDSQINLWFWNIITHSMNPNEIDNSWCEKWSFSRKDCKKYGMHFNPPPYFTELITKPLEIHYDLSFVGRDKGRLDSILDYKEKFEALGLKTKFVITPTNSLAKNPNYSPTISYEEAVKISSSSKAVFDYIEIPDSGQSMRVLECLFQNRKVVTNSQLVVDYDFYNKENIFVIGKDDLSTLKDFVESPYKTVPLEIIMQYEFDNFIDRFFSNENKFEKMLEELEG